MDVSAIASGSGTPEPVQSESTAAEQVSPQPKAQSAPGSGKTHDISPAIAKLFGASGGEQSHLNVSYRVVKGDPDEIVTVFTDPQTGQEVAQFPPQVLMGLAQFFDQENGITLDKNA
jgi:uncharacterized FlaG/YvyC family protein